MHLPDCPSQRQYLFDHTLITKYSTFDSRSAWLITSTFTVPRMTSTIGAEHQLHPPRPTLFCFLDIGCSYLISRGLFIRVIPLISRWHSSSVNSPSTESLNQYAQWSRRRSVLYSIRPVEVGARDSAPRGMNKYLSLLVVRFGRLRWTLSR